MFFLQEEGIFNTKTIARIKYMQISVNYKKMKNACLKCKVRNKNTLILHSLTNLLINFPINYASKLQMSLNYEKQKKLCLSVMTFLI